ncbi:MAG TPA: hypothetical protein VGC60_05845 [Pyrinomonadaceae bacterium]
MIVLISAVLYPTNGQNQIDRLAAYIAWTISEGNEVNQRLDFTKHLNFGDHQVTTIGIAFHVQFEKSEGQYLFEVVKGSEPPIIIMSFMAQEKGIAWRVTSTGEIVKVVTAKGDGHGNVQYFDIPKDKWAQSEKLFTQELDFWEKNLPEKYRVPKRNP